MTFPQFKRLLIVLVAGIAIVILPHFVATSSPIKNYIKTPNSLFEEWLIGFGLIWGVVILIVVVGHLMLVILEYIREGIG